jgi:LacI family transcriptional regulator
VAEPSAHSARAAVVACVERPDPPSAVLTVNLTTALAVLGAAGDLGIGVPGDLSLVTFDDHEVAAHLSVPLTCVRMPMHDLGRLGARTLLRMIDGGPGGSVQVPTAPILVRRASVGRPSVSVARRSAPA